MLIKKLINQFVNLKVPFRFFQFTYPSHFTQLREFKKFIFKSLITAIWFFSQWRAVHGKFTDKIKGFPYSDMNFYWWNLSQKDVFVYEQN